ncbi:kinase-like domain-containing protein [Ampelomyces quisqualis]|uniref:Kinase-like domain-containing protein n=1 Tax=Ampelomyces quisqualis TaxID=50730 RepID=A0A6A5QPR4_AMPQU|nr:kinase-like domain-containing protein [Ampelomyces quisqualis]
MSARTLTNVVNDQTVALNALIYGYAGHSLVTPHAALQQIWWTEERINEKVTQEFVTSRLQPQERERLTSPVGFGDLSDDTYIEWILEKARRLFLVLAEVGEADRIFAVVDKSWDDEDLPLRMDDIEQLALSNRRDNHADSRFYHTQFSFLLRELRDGVHIDYAPNEEVPLEYVQNLPAAVSLQNWSRVHLPKRPKEVYVRRRFALGNSEAPDTFEADFMMDVESARMVEHEHIAPIWASYTAKGTGFTVTNFVGQHTLRTFIDHRTPTQYQKLPKPDRRWLILNWLHCLADAIATLHQNGFCHSAIRPSNILIDERNAIAFSDIGSLETFQKDKRPDPMDVYIYGAPEAHTIPDSFDNDIAVPSPVTPTAKHASIVSKSSSGSSNSNGSQRQKLTKAPTADFSGFNFGFKRTTKPTSKARSRVHETEKADVFSLGCVFVEIITFMLKKKPHDFIKHRSSKQKINTGGKNSRTDSSFHANLDKIDTWLVGLEKTSFEHDDDAFRAIPPILDLIRSMLSRAPIVRPTAREVRDKLLDIVLHETAIPDIHCGEHKHDVCLAASSDGTSSAASLRTMSTMSTMSSTTSDTDTIRMSTASNSTAMSSILNSYSDRLTLSGISEDDGDSIRTIERPTFVNTSPSRLNSSSQKVKSWSKPFLLLP